MSSSFPTTFTRFSRNEIMKMTRYEFLISSSFSIGQLFASYGLIFLEKNEFRELASDHIFILYIYTSVIYEET